MSRNTPRSDLGFPRSNLGYPRSILGYEVDTEIFRNRRALIYRAHRPGSDAKVELKVLREPRPTPEHVAWFKREFDILRSLENVDGVLGALEFGRDGDHWAMVVEDIGGTSLAELVKQRPLPLEEALRVGARVAAILAVVHRRNIVHKDVNPSNIIYNRGTGQVRVIDFGIATQLSREDVSFTGALGEQDGPPGTANQQGNRVQEGTLAYISPEQTGRMNRSIDYRTDLYSLGATLYHLLTGRPPFAPRLESTTQDPLDLIHAHIARMPSAPGELNPEIPPIVSAIVLRLMAKNAEDRYQSADGVERDLLECSRQLRDTGAILPFAIAQFSRPVHFTLPQTLYGREGEIRQLQQAFERVAAGTTELVLVAGYSGVGKSALVQELYRPITGRHGYWIAGKFDQFQRDIPYASMAQAFRGLMRQLLGESADRVALWKTRLLEAIAPNGQVLIDVLPELALILGPQPEAPALPPAEAQIRLEHAFCQLVGVFAQAAHPLTLFLDDLQWVDPGSLQLLEALLLRSDTKFLLLLGAYRDNEVGPGHPLALMLARLNQRQVQLETLELPALGLNHVVQFVADTLGASVVQARPLAARVAAKTQGNPYFVREFLKSLYVEGLLRLEDVKGQPDAGQRESRWTWDLDAIAARDITDNVVELMAGKLRILPQETQDMLRLAGAMGSEFTLRTLALVANQPARTVWAELWPAVAAGMVVALEESWKLIGIEVEGQERMAPEVRCRFAHDRVQQAAYSLTPEAQLPALHWQIGQKLHAVAHESQLFAVVQHLNSGRQLATATERVELAAVNLEAARRAKASAAFGAAKEHSRIGLELLAERADDTLHTMRMALLTIGVETAYQTADFAQMDAWFADGVARAKKPLETAWMQEIKTEALNAQGRPLDALTHAMDYLDALGVHVPRQPTYDDVVAEMTAAAQLLAGRTLDDLAAMPDMQNPEVQTAVGLICKVYSSAYVASALVFATITLRQVRLVLEHGNCAVSPLAYAVYGLLQAALAGDVKTAYEFGKLSDRLLDRPDIQRYQAQALHLFSCHTRFWREHLRHSADGERRAYRVGLETGEMEFGCYGGHVASKYAFFHGQELIGLRAEIEQYTTAMHRYRNDLARSSHLPWHQTVLNLVENNATPWLLNGPICDAQALRPQLEAANDRMAISNTYLAQLILAHLFWLDAEALELADAGEAFLDAVLSQFNQPMHAFWASLSRLRAMSEMLQDSKEFTALLTKVDADLQKLQGWAQAAPVNFAQKVALVQAERARVLGQERDARDHYEEAILLAQEHEFVFDEAIAYESAGRFYHDAGRRVSARQHLREAYDVYSRWGALTKAAHLEGQFPEIVQQVQRIVGTSVATSSWGGTSRRSGLEFASVVRASQAISTEVHLPSLLRRLVTTLMENAGADRAVLLLDHDGELRVEAEGFAGRDEIEVTQGIPLKKAEDPEIPSQSKAPEPPRLAESVVNFVARSGESLVLDDALVAPESAGDAYVQQKRVRSILCQPILGQGKLRGVLYLENSLAPSVFTPARSELIGLLAGQIAISIDNARLYETLEERVRERTARLEARNRFIRRVFGRYVSDDVVDTVLESEQALELGGERRVVTCMFTDIRGFTMMCEYLKPEQVVKALNIFFSAMTRIVHRHQGTIDDIIGDGMLVLFGAPLWREDDADRAIACAIEMQLAMEQVNEINRMAGLPALALGIGIHTGDVVVGNIGSEQRTKYSVIGRNVNIASRVESMTTEGQIFATEATLAAVKAEVRVDGVQHFTPKGLAEPIAMHQIGGIGGRFGVALQELSTAIVPLDLPLPVRVWMVEGKAITARCQLGKIVAASDVEVEIHVEDYPLPGTGLQLGIDLPDGTVETLFAKVTSATPAGVQARLASRWRGLQGMRDSGMFAVPGFQTEGTGAE